MERTNAALSPCSSQLPWEKLSRKTLAPAMIKAFICSGAVLAGPNVAIILVRRDVLFPML
jgi:hypothetical protein